MEHTHSPHRRIDDIRNFLDNVSGDGEMIGAERHEKQRWVRAALEHVGYENLQREDRGLVRQYLQRATGYSRAQVERHISAYRSERSAAPVVATFPYVSAVTTVAGVSAPVVPQASRRRILEGIGVAVVASLFLFATLQGAGSFYASVISTSSQSSRIAAVVVHAVPQSSQSSRSSSASSVQEDSWSSVAILGPSRAVVAVTRIAAVPVQSPVFTSSPARQTPVAVSSAPVRTTVLHAAASSVTPQNFPAGPITQRQAARQLVASLNVAGVPTDGQFVVFRNGKAVWGDLPSDLVHGGDDGRLTGRGRAPSGHGGSGGGSPAPANNGGGTTTITNVTNVTGFSEDDSDARYVNIAGDTMTGSLSVRGTVSGALLTVSNLLNCDSIDTDANGNLICGTDAGASAGLSQVSGDARYVKKQGDTMTGGLLISANGGTADASTLLEVAGVISGRMLKIANGISDSGSLTVKGSTTLEASLIVRSSMSGASLAVSNLRNCDTIDTDANGNLVCGTDNDTDTNTTYNAGQGLSLNGTFFTLNSTITGSLVKFTTLSGSTVYAKNRLASSGSLAVQSGVTFKSLSSCQSLQTDSNGALSCAGGFLATSTGSLANAFRNIFAATSTGSLRALFNTLYLQTSTGSLRNLFDNRYVNTSGDTMTGGLLISSNGGTADAGTLLEVTGVISGRTLKIFNGITDSGSLVVKGSTTLQASLIVRSSMSGASLAVSNLRNCDTIDTDANGNLVCGTDSTAGSGLDVSAADARYVNIAGDTMTGALLVKAAISGASLRVSNLKSCDTIDTDINGNLVCGTDSSGGSSSTFGSGNVFTLANARYVRKQGDTMTGGLLIVSGNKTNSPTADTGVLLEVAGTMSGKVIQAGDILRSSGTLIVTKTTFFRNLTSCSALQTTSSGALQCATATSSSGFGSGNVFTLDNARYVKKQGDTMTGALLIVSSGHGFQLSADTGVLLEVAGLMSGKNLRIQNGLVSSGAVIIRKVSTATGNILVVDGIGLVYDGTNKRVGIGTASPETLLEVAGILSGKTIRAKDGFISSGAVVIRKRSSATGNILVVDTNGLVYDGSNKRVGIGTAAPETTLEVGGTLSGRILRVMDSLNSSGVLIVKGSALFQSNAVVRGNLSGASLTISNLQNCDTIDTDASGNFVCGTDASAVSSGTGGLTLDSADARYVKKQGDTMTGTLIINGGTISIGSAGAQVYNVLTNGGSASHTGAGEIEGSNDLYVEGALEVDAGAFFDGALTVAGTTTLNGTITTANNALIIDKPINLGGISGQTYNALSNGTGPTHGGVGEVEGTNDLYIEGTLDVGALSFFDGAVTFASTTNLNGTLATSNATYTFDKPLNVAGISGQAYNAYSNGTGPSHGGAGEIESSNDLWVEGALEIGGPLFADGNVTLGTNSSNTITPNGYFLGSLIPSVTNTYDLGSDTNRWRDLYLSGSSLHLGTSGNEAKIGYNTVAHVLSFSVSSPGGGFTINSDGNIGIGLNDPETSLEIAGTASGRVLYAHDSLQSSGSLVVHNYAGTATGNILVVDRNGLVYDATNRRVGIGTDTPDAALELIGLLSGSSIRAQNQLRSSGSLAVQNAVTFKSLTSCLSLQTSSNGALSCGNAVVSSGSIFTLTNNRYVRKQGDTMTGGLLIVSGNKTNAPKADSGVLLEVAGTMSGKVIQANDILRSSGTFIVTKTAFFRNLTSCSALQTTSSGALQCASAAGSSSTFGSGNVFTLTNNRYVRKQGDTMTGGLLIVSGNKTNAPKADSGIMLEVAGTMSGQIIQAGDILRSSGTLIVTKTTFFRNLTSCSALQTTSSGALQCTSAAASTSNFGSGNVFKLDNARYVKKQGDTMTGGLLIVSGNKTNAPTVETGVLLEVAGTMSGKIIQAGDILRSSGTLIVTKTTFFRNLTSCSALQTTSSGALQCTTAAASTSNFGSGNVFTLTNNRYVKRQGDTMTGGLLIVSGNKTNAPTVETGVLLEVAGTMSGKIIQAGDILRSSGTLIVTKTAFLRNLVSCSALQTTSSGALQCTSAAASTSNFGSGNVFTLTNNRYVRKQGDTMTGGLLIVSGNKTNAPKADSGIMLEVAGTMSGQIIQAGDILRSSGTLIVTKTTFFRNLTSCSALQTTSSGALQCTSAAASTSNFGSGNVFTLTNNRYVRKQGDTMTGGLLIVSGNKTNAPKADTGTLLEVAGTMSGQIIQAGDILRSSGTLIVTKTTFFRNLTSCSALQTTSSGALQCTSAAASTSNFGSGNVFKLDNARYVKKQGDTMTGGLLIVSGNKTNAPTVETGVLLEVAGTMSGKIIQAGDILRSSGTLIVTKTAFLRNLVSCSALQTTSSGALQCTSAAASTSNFGSGNVFTLTNNRYVRKQGDTMTGGLLIVSGNKTNAPKADSGIMLEVAGTMSGQIIQAGDILRSSGTLIVTKTTFFRNLTSCSALQTTSSGALQCTSAAASTSNFGSGNVFTLTNNRYVRKQGDTMTGGLLIVSGNKTNAPKADSGIMLEVAGTMSGQIIQAGDILRSSGTLIVTKTTFLRNLTSCSALQTTSSGALQCTSAAASTSNFGSGNVFKLDNARYVKKQGDTMTGGLLIVSGNKTNAPTVETGVLLEVAGTMSGKVIQAGDILRSSGTLIVTKTTFFRNLTSCSALQTTSSGALQCGTASAGTSSTFGSGNVFTLTNNRYVRKQGDTMTGGLLIVSGNKTNAPTVETGVLLEVAGTMSGKVIQAGDILRSSGTLIVTKTTFFRNLTSCSALQTTSSGALQCASAAGSSSTFGSGNVFTLTNNRYVKRQGDSMTGALMIRSGGNGFQLGADTGVLLEVAGIFSGRTIHAETGINSSGTLIVRKTSNTTTLVRFTGTSSTTLSASLRNLSAGSGSTTDFIVMNNSGSAAKNFLTLGIVSMAYNNAAATLFSARDGRLFTSDGNLNIGTASGKAIKFFTNGMMAGNEALRITSGGLIGIDKANPLTRLDLSGALTVGRSVGVSTGNLLIVDAKGLVYDGTNKRVGIGTSSPDTMLEVAGMTSGSVVKVKDGLFSSGVVVIRKRSTATGNILVVDTKGLVYDGSNKRVGIGTATPETMLEVGGTMSGRVLNVMDSLSSSGVLVVKGSALFQSDAVVRGNLSGASLTIMSKTTPSYFLGMLGIGKSTTPTAKLDVVGTISGSALTVSGLNNCDTIDTDGAGNLVCGTDAGASAGLSLDSGDARYVLKQGDTMTGTLIAHKNTPVNLGSQNTGLNSPYALAVQGRYAYVVNSGNNALVVYDVSNPASPVYLSTISTGLSSPNGIAVQGSYAYVTSVSSNSLSIFDITNPALPVYISQTTGNLSSPYGVAVQGRYVYVASYGNNAISIFDVSNPAAIVSVGTSTSNLSAPRSIVVQGRYAYLANYGNSSIAIYDISNPAVPLFVASAASGLSNPFSIYVQGRYAYLASYSNNSIVAYDISTPASPAFVSAASTDLANPSSIYVQGQYAYVTNAASSSITVYDVSNPASLVSVGTTNSGLSTPNALYVQGRYIYVASTANSSIVTFDVGGAYIQQLEAGGAELGTLTVSELFQGMDGAFQGGLTVGQSLNVSGSGTVHGALTVNSLQNCALVQTTSNGTLTCGSGSTGGDLTSTGALAATFDHRYVLKQGDTMTGSLIINNGARIAIGGVGIQAYNAISDSSTASHGSYVTSDNDLYTEGAMEVDGTAFFDGTIVVGGYSGGLSYNMLSTGGSASHGTIDANNDLYIEGALEVDDGAFFDGAMTVAGTTTLNGDVNLGDATSDTINANGYFGTSLIPKTDNAYDLGTDALRWRSLYVDAGTIHIGASGNEATLSYDTSNNNIAISKALDIGGITGRAYNAFSDSGTASHTSDITSDNDLYVEGALEVDAGSFFDGAVSMASTLNVASTVAIGGIGNQAYNAISDSGTASHGSDITSDNDLYIEGALEVDAASFFDGGLTVINGLTANALTVTTASATINGLNYSWPGSNGGAGSVLTNDGLGALTWTSGGGGITLPNADARYVLKQGDTMTGSLIINNGARIAIGGVGIQAYNAISDSGTASHGSDITSDNDLYIEGALEVDAGAFFDGAITVAGTTTLDGTITSSNTGLLFAKPFAIDGIGVQAYNAISTSTTASHTSDIDAGSDLYVQGALEVDSNSFFDGQLTIDQTATINGDVNLGDSTSDTITANGRFGSSLVPTADNTYDLGTDALRWRSLYVDGGTIHIGSSGNEGTISYNGASTTMEFSAPHLTFNSVLYTFPNNDGNANEVLTTDGNGGLSWTAAGGGISESNADARYVLKQGDTMSGAFVINGNVTLGPISSFSVSSAATFDGGIYTNNNSVFVSKALNIGGVSNHLYNAISNSATPSHTGVGEIEGSNDLFIEGALEVDANSFFEGNLTINGGTVALSNSAYHNCAELTTDGIGNIGCGTTAIPTDTSQLTNGAGFITSASLPTDDSQLTNGAGYLTNIVGLNITDLTNNAGYITASSADNLTNKSGNISQWTNDSGYYKSGDDASLNSVTIATTLTLSSGGFTSCNGTNQALRTDGSNNVYCGDVTTAGSDYAEDYPTMDPTLGSGEIVALDANHPGYIRRATGSGSERVIGVISTKPGMILHGDPSLFPGARQVPVALSGRVPVRVNGENGRIAVGDRITLSSIPGMAKKAWKNDDAVGFAMERFHDYSIADTGSIIAFVNLSTGPVATFSGTTIHASELLSSDGGLRIAGAAVFGSGVTIATHATHSGENLLTISSDVHGSGDTVFRVTAGGDVSADGAFTGGGADYAEWFTTTDKDMKFGEAVCIDVTKANSVRRCTTSGDPDIIGLVSSLKQAAFIGNKFSGAEGLPVPNTVLVGLLGQLSANVVVESDASGQLMVIRPGDSLAAGTVPGTLRKAQPGESTVGVALEGIDAGQGMRKVLIARKNQSLTAETVSERVLQTVKDLKIEDELKLSLQSAVHSLSASGAFMAPITQEVQKQMAALSLPSLTDRLSALEARIAALSGSIVQHPSPPEAPQPTIPVTTTGSMLTGDIVGRTLSIDQTITARDGRFAGDLYVDGIFNVRDLYVPHGVQIDGDLHANTLALDSDATINGTLTLNSTLNLTQGMNFGTGSILSASDLLVRGALHAIGPVTIDGLATFLGDVQIHGQLTLSSRQAGFAGIPKTGTSVTITFTPPLSAEPVINVTPKGRIGGEWWMESASATGFTIAVADPAKWDLMFDWTAIVSDDTQVTQSQATASVDVTPFPVDEHGIPVSTSDAWNSCIRNHPLTTADGSPVNCGGFHDGYIWQHPDLNITFVYNTSLTPPLLQLPEHFASVTQQSFVSSSSDSSASSESSTSSSSDSSLSSSSSSADSSESSVSSSSESSIPSSSSSSSLSSSSESSYSSNSSNSSNSSSTPSVFPPSAGDSSSSSVSSPSSDAPSAYIPAPGETGGPLQFVPAP